VRYRLNVDGVTDFAGNAAGPPTLDFTTRAAPPLVAEDGFESVTGPTLDGAQILLGPAAPVIAGTRSLYMPSAPSPTAQATQFALRLAVAPGDTVVRFSYRVVEPPSRPDSTPFAVGSPGASRLVMMLPRTTAPNELVTIADRGSVWVGPLATAEIPLPPDAASEVVIARIQRGYGCPGALLPPVEGIIIDDLRVE